MYDNRQTDRPPGKWTNSCREQYRDQQTHANKQNCSNLNHPLHWRILSLIVVISWHISYSKRNENRDENMSDDPSLFIEDTRSNWIRLCTSIAIRWVAIVGQLIAVFVALQYYRCKFRLITALFIGLSIIAICWPPIYIPKQTIIRNRKLMFALFDLFQLSA